MANELALPASFGLPPAGLASAANVNDELGAGVASSYGILGYKGKVWSMRYGGNETPLMRDDGDGARGSVEVVIVKSSSAVSKIFYEKGYIDGSNEAPDCWSANGIAPDTSVQKKVNPTCADCPMNAWGSRVSEAGKPGKACADSRRVAIVPLADIDNELFGGPMLLRVPAASLKDLKAYGDLLQSHQFPYYAAATRISFDPQEAYPKFVFNAIRPLTQDELNKVLTLREDRKVAVVLSETAATAPAAVPVAALPKSQFEQPMSPAAVAVATPVSTAVPGAVVAQPAQVTPAPVAAPAGPSKKELARQAAEKAAAEAARLAALAEADDDEDVSAEEDDEAPSDFAAMLDSVLKD